MNVKIIIIIKFLRKYELTFSVNAFMFTLNLLPVIV